MQEGQLHLDIPVRSYLPNFKVNDPVATEQISLRDLLCHRTGLPGNNYEGWRLWRKTNRSFEELIQRLPFTDLAYPLRTRFNYGNLGYTIAGEIIARIAGSPWSDVCKQKILTPLSMKRTFFSHSLFLADENSAQPHAYSIQDPIPAYDWEKDQMLPASGMISCARDMALWLRYCLANVPAFGEALQPQMRVPPEHYLSATALHFFPLLTHGQSTLDYGFGWLRYSLEDRLVYKHTGSSVGMQSVLAIVPEEELGIVILSNQAGMPALSPLMNQLIDHILNRPANDWQTQAKSALLEKMKLDKGWQEQQEAIRNREITTTLTLDAYAGIYTHLGYGDILIEWRDDKLSMEFLFSHDKGTLTHWEADRFEIQEMYGSLKPWLCEFLVSEGKATALQMPHLGLFSKH